MKKIFVLITGLTPFLIGYGLNLMIINLGVILTIVLDMIGVVFFLYWGLLGFKFSKFTSSKVYTLVIFHLPALLVLLLVLFQELINKQYWNNYLGITTQFFYLPTIIVSSKIMQIFSMHEMWKSYILSFALMIAVFYLGCYIRDRGEMTKEQDRI